MTVWNIFTAIRYLLWPFRNVVVIWYIFPRFGIFREEKSGNPGVATKKVVRRSSTATLLEFGKNLHFVERLHDYLS
jgi:hypothetical protein